MGLLLPNKLTQHGGKCSARERQLLKYGGMTQHGDSGTWSFSSLLRATKPRLLICFCPSSAGAQDEWLWTKFCVFSFKEVGCISSHLFLLDRNPTAFQSWMLCGCLSRFWCSRLRSPAWGLDPTLLKGNPPSQSYLSRTSTAREPTITLTPPYLLPVSMWLLL